MKGRSALRRIEDGGRDVQVADGIHRLTNGVSNFYVVDEGGKLILVDAGIPRDWGRLVHALPGLGHTADDLAAVLLTHAHSDHTGFAERARADAHAEVWIHEADVAVAKGGPQGKNQGKLGKYLVRAEAWRTIFGLLRGRGGRIVPIHEVSSFADGQTIPVPGRPRAVHVPGHTPGMSSVIFERRRVLLTGDCLVMRNPLTGRKGPQIMPDALNRDSDLALRSLDRLEGLPADIVLPGHGEPWKDGVAKAVALARTAGRS
jgi:glyoxylase-like metal-dependent hydrolase (beta-lactamase superfamily II)